MCHRAAEDCFNRQGSNFQYQLSSRLRSKVINNWIHVKVAAKYPPMNSIVSGLIILLLFIIVAAILFVVVAIVDKNSSITSRIPMKFEKKD